MSLFPIFLKLTGRECLVVGAGQVGEPKIESLLRAEARVRVVAPQATPTVAAYESAGRLIWEPRKFLPTDLDRVFLAIATTDSADVNHEVFLEARRRNILCNVVDDPEHCDFYYPAVVNRGDLQIAISTGGQSPSFAQHLRKELEQQFGPEYEEWVKELGKARREILASGISPDVRKALLHGLAARRPFEQKGRGSARKRRML